MAQFMLWGPPEAVMIEENIEAVYGIKSKVTRSVVGLPQITPPRVRN